MKNSYNLGPRLNTTEVRLGERNGKPQNAVSVTVIIPGILSFYFSSII